MKRPALLSAILFLLAVAMICGIVAQRQRLSDLRGQEKAVLAALADSPEPAQSAARASSATSPASSSSPELLRLRNQVNQLTQRQREMAGARAENAQLRTQLVKQGTGPAGTALSPNYIRKSRARMVGYSTPANTLQTLLWAMQTGNITNILQTFTPEIAAQIGLQDAKQSLGREVQEVPGLNILRQQPLPDGSMALEVEIVPGVETQNLVLRQIAGEWKIAAAGR